jgi:DNA-binding NarL/FixJ family response regulator
LALFQGHAESIDVVLLDLHLPAESTPELLDALRALRPDIRVVLMSGLPEPVALQRVARDGIMGFLCKPFSPTDLTRTLETVLRGCDPSDPAGAAGGAVLGTTLRPGSLGGNAAEAGSTGGVRGEPLI